MREGRGRVNHEPRPPFFEFEFEFKFDHPTSLPRHCLLSASFHPLTAS